MWYSLKGQCHEIFCFRVFSWITFPQAPDNNIRIISNFFKNSLIYSQVKVHHRCQRHWWQICHRCQWPRWQIAAGINDTSGKFATGISDTGGKFCHQFPLCCWHRWQIIGTISGCRYLIVNLKAKIYIYVSSTTQRWQNKIIAIFLIEDFFHLPPVSLTPVANLELRISQRIFEKIRNDPNVIIRGLGNWFKKKTRSKKSRDTVPLKGYKHNLPFYRMYVNIYPVHICVKLLTASKFHASKYMEHYDTC